MFLKRLIGLVFAGTMIFGSAMASDVVIRLAPPKVRVERRGDRPSPDHVWVSGYQRWDGNSYRWTEGSWQQPPRRHAKWVGPRWQQKRGNWVMVEGRWK
jgi:hypothetical protein